MLFIRGIQKDKSTKKHIQFFIFCHTYIPGQRCYVDLMKKIQISILYVKLSMGYPYFSSKHREIHYQVTLLVRGSAEFIQK